ncbi:hypothetical protein N7G274_002481 [Stereocaulon virgatum]|uniref:Cytochrome P450 n=1 Tax=Stereocaulon virgatum TaxID=373712 RepID=A0ABR4AFW2_9LECA
MSFLLPYSVAAATGVACHLGYFNRGEHHLYGVRYLQALFTASLTLGAILAASGVRSFSDVLQEVTKLIAFFLAGLYTSLLAYRVLFSPLNRFPGPFGAKFSNFWFSLRLSKRNAFQKVLELHSKYGDFLRIGSNDLSIVHPEAVKAIYGPGSPCRKADWYDLTHPRVSLQTLRSRMEHDQRRRTWSMAFSDKALHDYEQRVNEHQDKLLAHIANAGGRVNVSRTFNFYNFDVMGDLAFGQSFNMLTLSEYHSVVKLLHKGLQGLGYHFPTWFFRIMIAVPRLDDEWSEFMHYCSKEMQDRITRGTSTPDISSTLLKPYDGAKPSGAELRMLEGDANLNIVAGSDTTAAVMTYIIYELVRHPSHISKLRKELASIDPFICPTKVQHQQLQHLDHLNGVIYETLRLYPPVPTAIPRLTPPEGLTIRDVYVPGNTTVWSPQYVLGRSSKVYNNAESFIPERWYSNPELIKERSAFAPFSIGKLVCKIESAPESLQAHHSSPLLLAA